MEILKIIFLSLGMSLTYILITLIISFFTYKKIKLPDLIDWKMLASNSLILSIPFFFIIWGLPLLFDSIVLSEVVVNIILFLTISIVPSYEYLISPLIIIRNKKLVEIDLSNRVKNITGNIKIFKVNKEFANAYAIGVLPNSKSIILSNDLIKEMSQIELDGIISHEIGHLKNNHLFKLYLSALFALLIGYISTFYFYPIIDSSECNIHILRAIHGAFFYGLPMWIIPALFQRSLEYKADIYASKSVGKNYYVNSLKKLDNMTNGTVSKGGITHPSLKKRIKNILK
jgi:Zn-dependent protease with chaperone function